jgi:hypothetical protein
MIIVEHGFFGEYEKRVYRFLEKLQLQSQIICFDVFSYFSQLD